MDRQNDTFVSFYYLVIYFFEIWYCVAQAGFELLIFLSQPLKCWDCRHMSSCLTKLLYSKRLGCKVSLEEQVKKKNQGSVNCLRPQTVRQDGSDFRPRDQLSPVRIPALAVRSGGT